MCTVFTLIPEYSTLYFQVTVHRDNLHKNNQKDASSIQNFILSHNLHETYQLQHVQLITPDDGHRRCPKRAEFRDKIKFWILDASCWLFI
jgi:cysteinyl-tRNA synthetase